MERTAIDRETEERALSIFMERSLPSYPQITPCSNFETIPADALLKKSFSALLQPVQGLISEGVTLFVGASKIGKSWLVLDLCISVALGKTFLGRATTQGAVLYMALEDSERRIKERLEKLEAPEEIGCLHLRFDSPTVENGLCEKLDGWISNQNNAVLIVIDTLQKVRGVSSGSRQVYASDYDFICKLKKLANKHHISIVLVHHTNKLQNVDDVYDKTNGSTGLMGAADTSIIMRRKRTDDSAIISYTGRDVYGNDFCIRFSDFHWIIEEHSFDISHESKDVIKLARIILQEYPKGIKCSYQDVLTRAHSNGLYIGLDSKAFIKNATLAADYLKKEEGIILKTGERVKNHRGISLSKI